MSDKADPQPVFGKVTRPKVADFSRDAGIVRSAAHKTTAKSSESNAKRQEDPTVEAKPKEKVSDTEKRTDTARKPKKRKPKERSKLTDDYIAKLVQKHEDRSNQTYVNTTLRIEERSLQYLKAYSAITGMTQSEVYRLAVHRFLESEDVLDTLEGN